MEVSRAPAGRLLTRLQAALGVAPRPALVDYCPCCGYRTLPERLTYELCPVCFWEDDPHQVADPDLPNGANGLSLIEAQKMYLRHGAMHPDFARKVRSPRPGEERTSDWHPYTPR